MVVILCSCDIFEYKETSSRSQELLTSSAELVELTFEGHTHQFVFTHAFAGGYGTAYDVEIVHWPSCKYCQENK